MTQIINLTPHALHFYRPGTPERIAPENHDIVRVIEPSGDIARLGVNELSGFELDGLWVEQLDHSGCVGLPPYAGHMDSRDREIWYVVSLVTALASPGRCDLLVVHGAIRDLGGHVIGCTMLGRPV